ncbi:MAG: TM0996/MTH895 family glutaredoxin-like protein [Petrotogaceae bacterium]|jgi:small redox-active disulfide protein 2|nr:TM0996/MTH895 family glutaredoxin-like protein [Petrotogaceae bacterium]
MDLFKRKIKNEEIKSCCCNGNSDSERIEKAETVKSEGASVKILGGGCAKCNQLEEAVKEALIQLGMNASIDHVKDFSEIAAYGVMSTPALVIDEKVVSYGKVLKTEEVIKILQKVK